jgi:fermentation-respiration switch protein FrsA (DUF1100 family)
MRCGKTILGLLLCLLLNGCVVADQLFYAPDAIIHQTPKAEGLAFESVQFKSADGTLLSGWFVPATTTAHGTVIHFHGNAANIGLQFGAVSWLPKNGFNVLVFDYRGYGESQGRPNRDGLYADAVAAMRYLKTRQDIDQSKIIVFGQSLGAALALRVVGNNHFDGIVGVVEESGFASYQSVAHDHYWFLGDLLVPDYDEPAAAAAKISPIPLLIIHGDHDSVVSYAHAKAIYAAAHEPKELWTVPGGEHLAATLQFGKIYKPRLLQKFRDWTGSPSNPPSP